jgi:hypothetical protein
MMNTKLGCILAGLGGSLAIIAFFLPWVQAPETLLTLLRWLATFLGQDLNDLIAQLSQAVALSGRQLAFDLPWVSTGFKLPILLPLILGILSLLWILASASSLVSVRLGDIVLAALAVIGGLLLAFDGAEITRLGVHFPLIDTLLPRFGLRLSWGYWISIVGLVFIALGAWLGIAGSGIASSPEDEPLSEYS